ncbi:MAG: hypothetical protein HDT35_08220, partial [Clostridiales bacterium]|nr:hypothetical protein [Clostridiales bacterium]
GTMVQILETDPGQEVTASYLTDDGVFPAEYDSETRTFAITAEGALLHAAKLELGAVQTLAHQDEDGNWVLNDPTPNKALELAKCQRYQLLISGNIGLGISNGSEVYMPILLPVSLRAKPAIKYEAVVLYRGIAGERIAVNGISASEFTNGYVLTLRFIPETKIPAQQPCYAFPANSTIIILDANL